MRVEDDIGENEGVLVRMARVNAELIVKKTQSMK